MIEVRHCVLKLEMQKIILLNLDKKSHQNKNKKECNQELGAFIYYALPLRWAGGQQTKTIETLSR